MKTDLICIKECSGTSSESQPSESMIKGIIKFNVSKDEERRMKMKNSDSKNQTGEPQSDGKNSSDQSSRGRGKVLKHVSIDDFSIDKIM